MDNYIVGRNAVKEALKAGRSIQRILVSDDKVKTGLSDIVGLAKSKGVEVRPTPVKQMNRYETDVPHQGVIAFVNAVEFKDLGEVLQESNHENPLLILTDGVEDPHNMGAIIRTAECVGATAVLIPKRHNAPINATVAKTSAGAVEQIPLVQVGNVTQTIKQLQKQEFWVLGAHMDGDRTLYEADLTIPTVLVIGNEGKGISRVVKEACDFLVTIPMYGNLNSLNASVAAAILMYEAVRQRTMKVK
ncbi:23S rRNA (guanosine(2251)-2'-O)-methyltransferase RlmB [Veillonella atypica]|uniref:23S rRNA (guanosine(2251)-2'-O)-methyltransferase RlmB n=1 Tax=Veillonella atypica TaxID=39777 RepID=UPI00352D65CE